MLPVLVPDMPPPEALMPLLEAIARSGRFTNFGPMVGRFERDLADLLGPGAAVCTTSSCTAALEAALGVLDLAPGTAVLLPSFTFPATALAVCRAGLRPVFCDVDPQTWTLTPAIARDALPRAGAGTGAVVPVAAFGCPVPADEWSAFSRDTGAAVVVDAAAALGRQGLADGLLVAFSLHATKPLGIGEGGLVAGRDADRIARVRRAINFGLENGTVTAGGFNGKLSEMAAAVGVLQLARREDVARRRLAVRQAYRAALARLPGVRLQRDDGDAAAVLVVQTGVPAETVAAALADAGIETRRWYAPPLHRQPRFAGCRRIGPDGGPDLPVTDGLADRAIGLPFHGFLTPDDVGRVVGALAAAPDRHRPPAGGRA
ncbi:DegT/DnrJ/EryC1/StrS family aminotransferase [Azospirillum halopraeferens]|uniref:DegT/DnrJ/EryC1/StrS family aminotransferase n=1 Tax=Azospirillum halopraeferens TaxID=34010 RepID=UPI00041A7CC7|nr:aminotransferase class I/II-fold pyridoxal phosphate-dependent enzyme [Azospirillum halopraeferens]